MARRKKAKKSHRRRGRRVSGVHPAIMQTGVMMLGAGLGAGAAVMAYQALKTSVTSVPPVALAGGIAAAGGALPLFLKPSPMVMGAAAGMAGMALVFACNEAGLSLPGISGMPGTGFVNKVVGYPGNYPKRSIGNMSGNKQGVVAGIFSN